MTNGFHFVLSERFCDTIQMCYARDDNNLEREEHMER